MVCKNLTTSMTPTITIRKISSKVRLFRIFPLKTSLKNKISSIRRNSWKTSRLKRTRFMKRRSHISSKLKAFMKRAQNHFMKRTNNFMKRIKIKHFMKKRRKTPMKSQRKSSFNNLRIKNSFMKIFLISWRIMMPALSLPTLTSNIAISRIRSEFTCSSEASLKDIRFRRFSRILTKNFLSPTTILKISMRFLTWWKNSCILSLTIIPLLWITDFRRVRNFTRT